VWFHDIFRTNGVPYSRQDVDFLRKIAGDSQQSQGKAKKGAGA
jgi:hypothetical protein